MLSINAAILVNSAFRLISSARMNWPNPPVGPRTRTEVRDMLSLGMRTNFDELQEEKAVDCESTMI